MVNQVIYERPKLSFKDRIKMYWTLDEIFIKGYTKEFIDNGGNKDNEV